MEVANITAMLRHESVDANGNANDDLTCQFSVDQPFYCDKKSADQAIVSGGVPQLMATTIFSIFDGVNFEPEFSDVTSLTPSNGDCCGSGVTPTEFLAEHQSSDEEY